LSIFWPRRVTVDALSTQKMAPGKVVLSFSIIGLGVDDLSCDEKTRNKQRPTQLLFSMSSASARRKQLFPTKKMAACKVVILSSLSWSSALGVDDLSWLDDLSYNNKKGTNK